MEKPSNLLLKLSRRLFADQTERERFVSALVDPQSFHPCILWCREKPDNLPFAIETPTAWQPEFVDRLALGTKPGQHSLHELGYYYCLDFSSVFAASSFLNLAAPIDLVFDICASPGGKSIFAWKALSPKLLISNEAIGKRIGAIVSNLKRCQIRSSIAINRDSKVLKETFPATSNLVIVDAPCSGQSLLAKGGKAPGCFHESTINKNANRQKRIIANSAGIVAPQGYLSYMTCTYSTEENEQVGEWFLKKFPQFEPVVVPHLAAYQSHLTDLPCYRMLPQDKLGAGAFTMLFKNTEAGVANQLEAEALEKFTIIQI